MKTFVVTVSFSHEPFGGYDHNDGSKEYTVCARNADSAKKKALVLAKKEGGGYERRVSSVLQY